VTELPIDDAAGLASAAHDAAERGQVVYLTDPQGRRIAAIVPASVAAAGAAAIEALEDAADLAVAEEALAEWDADDRRTYRLADVDAELSESWQQVAAYEVELTGRARKQYTALDPVIRDRVRAALRDLANDPTPAQVKALAGGGGLLRVRVGAWRVIYHVEHDQARVVIVDIGHRSTVYRRR
jgi:mRNA interferase RelE/StbE